MFGGIDAAIGGASGELFKVALASQELQAWRSNELNKQREYYEQGLIDAQLYANNVVNINQQMLQRQTDLQDSWRSATLSTFSSVTGDAAEMLRGLGDESSGIYKAMFIASKAAAIAQAWINTELAATRAIAELGPIAGPPMAQFVRGIGYASIGIMSATAMQGFKTGGYTGSVGVNDVAGLVHGREFVFDHQATSRIGVDNLEALRTGRLASDDLARRVNSDFKRAAADGVMQTVQITNNIYPQSTETTSSGMQDNESQKMIKRINEMQAAATRKVLLEELRPMGLLDPNRKR
jgi:phage-related minor tail protein